MSETIDLKELERKAYRESLQDGFMEIAIGGLMYLCGILIPDPVIRVIFAPFYVLYLAFLPRGLEAFKQRYTYPRLGRAVLHRQNLKPLLAGASLYMLGAAALIAVGLVVSGRLIAPEWYRWLPTWLGLCLAGVFCYIYSRSGSLRYLVYAFVALGAAAVIGSIRLPSAKDYLAVYLICTGTLCALTGAITLIRFVRSHPLAAQEVPDENAQS